MFFAFLAAFMAISAVSLLRSALQVSRDASAGRARLAELAAKKKELEAEIRERGTEESVRYQAHLRLNLKNSGEAAVVVLPEQKESPAAAAPSFWQNARDIFQRIISGRW